MISMMCEGQQNQDNVWNEATEWGIILQGLLEINQQKGADLDYLHYLRRIKWVCDQ